MAKTKKPSGRKGPSLAVIVLAAGESKRFKSKTPKVLHDLCGKPLVRHVLDACASLKAATTVLVISPSNERLRDSINGVTFAIQKRRLGTADAARAGDEVLGTHGGDVLILPGDTPLLEPASLRSLVKHHRTTKAAATVLTARFANPSGYGRIVRANNGGVSRIVEDVDCTAAERAIDEGNTGVYVFDRAALRSALTKVEASNKQKEQYLPDVIGILSEKGERIEALPAGSEIEAMGVNDRAQLAVAASIMRSRICTALMRDGVTIEDPSTVFIDATVRIGPDTVIRPFTFLRGSTRIGSDCVIGPSVELIDCRVADDVRIQRAVARETVLHSGSSVGPYASLRPGTVLKRSAKAGTFVETKKTTIGEGSKVPHLSYMGDATIGRNSNVGAGSITCNYDGETSTKSRTIIGNEVLIGSDTMLVAPVKIADRAVTGASAVVTRDVRASEVVVGAPAKVRRRRTKPDTTRAKKGKRGT